MANVFRVAWAAWRIERSTRRRDARNRDERAFLPAVLEIVESPPSPTARYSAMLLAALVALAVAWAVVGRVDVVAVADGRIVPSGRVKVLQPLEAGLIRAIHVHDGSSVRAGDVMIELDPTSTGTERERLAADLAAAEVTAARLRALLAAGSQAQLQRAFAPPKDMPAGIVATQSRLMLEQWQENAARLRVLQSDIARRQAERAGIAAAIAGLERSLPVQRERQRMRDELARSGDGSRLSLLDETQRLLSEERELAVQRERLAESSSAIRLAEDQMNQQRSESRRAQLAELNQAEQRVAALRQELIGADSRQRQQTLRAPIAGTVQQLAVHTVGGVVTAAQPLLVIVPADDTLEVEAALQNRDVGFVHDDQPAEIKIETFLFTRYGTVPGRVVSISSDAVLPPAARSDGAASSPVYVARVRLDRTHLDVDGRSVKLAPGMRATVEIKTGRRRVIEFLLSPIARYRHDSLRER
jgi:hemolysin D